jgi:predicted DNA-binding transcriptional regulator YafY
VEDLAVKTRTTALAQKASQAREFISTHPGSTPQEVMAAVKIHSEASLYRLLLGLSGDSEICREGVFCVSQGGQNITIDDIEDFLENDGTPAGRPPLAERLLYIYHYLEQASRDGGIRFETLCKHYRELLEQYSPDLPKDASIKRSLQRDLSRLESFGIAIDRPSAGSRNKAYRLRQEYLPKVSLESAAALYVSTLLHRNTLLDDAVNSVRINMESGFFKGMPERAKLLKERLYILGDTLSHPEQFGQILGRLIRAVSESYRVKVEYVNNSGKTSSRLLEPLGLVSKRNVWYVIARQGNKAEIKTFRVDQIQRLTGHESDKFHYPQDFSLQAHIGSSWGVFCNDPVQRVRLRFSPEVASRVKKLRYHPSQAIVEESKDGSVVVQFEACGLIEMQSWIMQWGDRVEVLEPAPLRKRVLAQAQRIAELYSK